VHENPIMSMCWVDINISGSFGLLYVLLYFWHPIDSRHNTTLFLELTGSKLLGSGIFENISV
jgi:hypothetical protein